MHQGMKALQHLALGIHRVSSLCPRPMVPGFFLLQSFSCGQIGTGNEMGSLETPFQSNTCFCNGEAAFEAIP